MLLGGLTHWTVGLIATFMTVACTIAADTGAYAFGKTLGRTQLISISPKKTVEGAVGGLACSTVVALAFWRFLRWPAQVTDPCIRALTAGAMHALMQALSWAVSDLWQQLASSCLRAALIHLFAQIRKAEALCCMCQEQ